jgi:hypothetical protein
MPTLVVTDIAGRGVIRRQLPQGTGSRQEVLVETGGLPSGLYRFELHDRAERSVIPVVIVK